MTSIIDLETLAREVLNKPSGLRPYETAYRLANAMLELCERLRVAEKTVWYDEVRKLREDRDHWRTRAEKADRFIDELISDFWTGCDDPQSNFALVCKHAGCIQCRLIAWRAAKEKE